MAPRSGTVSKDWLNAKFEALEEKLDANTQILRDHMAQDRVDFDLVDRKLDAHNLRVDRLEQARAEAEKNKSWLRSFGPSILGAMTGAIFGWFGVGK